MLVSGLMERHSIVISVFAIIILSVLGAMFANGDHVVMGSEEDPKDGKKVATAVFSAVIIYAVSPSILEREISPNMEQGERLATAG